MTKDYVLAEICVTRTTTYLGLHKIPIKEYRELFNLPTSEFNKKVTELAVANSGVTEWWDVEIVRPVEESEIH